MKTSNSPQQNKAQNSHCPIENDELADQVWQDSALIEAINKLEEENKPVTKVLSFRPNRKLLFPLGLAASIICFTLFSALSNQQTELNSNIQVAATKPLQAITPRGQRSEITLQDGSLLKLNANSELLVTLSAKQRHVEFEQGEVFFDVAKDKQRPFIIKSNWGDIQVLGTSFNVDKTRNNLNIKVFEGKVAVTNIYGKTHYLVSGQGINLDKNGSSDISTFSNTAYMDWQQGILRVENESLDYVLEKLNRYSEKQLYLAPEIASNRVTGTFILDDIEQTLTLLCQLYNLDMLDVQGDYFLTPTAG